MLHNSLNVLHLRHEKQLLNKTGDKQMTRYVYNHNTDKEIAITKHYNLNEKYWIMGPSFKPVQIAFCKANESFILFRTPKACIEYYK